MFSDVDRKSPVMVPTSSLPAFFSVHKFSVYIINHQDNVMTQKV